MDYIRILYISYGSVCELETWDIISREFRLNWKRWIEYTKQRHSGNRKNVKSTDKVFKKQTLESLTPGILVGTQCKSAYGGAPLLQLNWRRTIINSNFQNAKCETLFYGYLSPSHSWLANVPKIALDFFMKLCLTGNNVKLLHNICDLDVIITRPRL